jgi:hypothetical protein
MNKPTNNYWTVSARNQGQIVTEMTCDDLRVIVWHDASTQSWAARRFRYMPESFRVILVGPEIGGKGRVPTPAAVRFRLLAK